MDNTENYRRAIVSSLNQFRKERSFCDAILCCEGTDFHVHRCILSASSDYFLGLFSSQMQETIDGRIDLNKLELNAYTMETILLYMYTGEVTVDNENARDIIIASDFFLLSQLKEKACDILLRHITSLEAVAVFSLAEKYNCPELSVQAKNLILSNFVDIAKTDVFKNLNVGQVSDIVSSDSVFAMEEEIFEALLEWTVYDLENRKECFSSLFSCIRLNHISENYLSRFVEENELVKNSTTCLTLMTSAKEFHATGAATNTGAKPRQGRLALIAVGGYQTGHGISASTTCLFTHLNKWLPLVSMETARYGHGLCVCNGFIYAVGGFSSPYSAERYDPRTNRWCNIIPLSEGVTNPGLAHYKSNLYVVGGSTREPTNKIQRYSPLKDMWNFVTPMHIDRDGPCAIGTEEFLYAIGGYSKICGRHLNSVERYDISSGRWKYVTPMNKARYCACAAYVNKKIYVIGGKDGTATHNCCEMYDPEIDQWEIISYMCVPRFGAGLAVIDNKMYVCGGRENACSGLRASSIECCDVEKQKWEIVAEMQKPMFGVACCAFVLNRNILSRSIP